jgi:hypothetical protein
VLVNFGQRQHVQRGLPCPQALQWVESLQTIPAAAGMMVGLAPLKLTFVDMETADILLLLPLLLAYYLLSVVPEYMR